MPSALSGDLNPLSYASWEERFAQLEAFKAEHGHCRVVQEKPAAGHMGREHTCAEASPEPASGGPAGCPWL